jgi:glycerol-3-phosphate acyltransferase PlsY
VSSWRAAVVVPAAYLAGTFPTADLVGRVRGLDPSAAGSGNPGASNVYRLAGARAGFAVFAGDLAKGALATMVGDALGDRPLAFAAGTAAVLGHMFPVTRGLRGGRGVATAGGLAVVLYPGPAAALAAGWFLVARLTGKASVASLLMAGALPAAVAAAGRPAWEVRATAALAALVVLRHGPNLRRLARGEESSLGRVYR